MSKNPSSFFLYIRKLFRYGYNKARLSIKERKFGGRLKYIYEDKQSDELMVVFSGFASRVPKYNYMRTLKDVKVDKLFILDDFGYRGSYYWFLDGTDKPLQLTNGLINHILKRKSYKKLMMAGSSKGGTCAIYFGLEHHANEIFASACQYHVGTYLSTPNHKRVLEEMMGKDTTPDNLLKLNEMLPEQIRKYANSNQLVYLCYSKDEHTYADHIVDLIDDLKNKGVQIVEIVDSYSSHDDNGVYFSNFLKHHFLNSCCEE